MHHREYPGRIIYGFGVGFAMQGAPAYIGEMAPPAIRGLLVSLKEAFIVLGMLLGYSIGYLYSKTSGGWRSVYGLASPLAVVMFAGMYFLPPSAPWLASQRRLEEAEQSLRFVTPQPSSAQLRVLQDTAQTATVQAMQGGPPSMLETYRKLRGPTVWPALVAGVGMVFFQQTTGQPSVLYYADTIFEDIGVTTAASIAISLFKLIATLLTTFTVDRYGRKKLLYIGCSLMLCALIMLGVAFSFPYSNIDDCEGHTSEGSCPSTCHWDTSDPQCSTATPCELTNFRSSVHLYRRLPGGLRTHRLAAHLRDLPHGSARARGGHRSGDELPAEHGDHLPLPSGARAHRLGSHFFRVCGDPDRIPVLHQPLRARDEGHDS